MTGCSMNGKTEHKYASRADWAGNKLIERYWNENGNMMNNAYPYAKDREVHLNYWWKAHAVDALIDAYERTGDEHYTAMAEELVTSIIKRNGSLFNEFYDDMEWLALATLRLYDATGSETAKHDVLKLWDDIKTGWWDDELGGMAWKKEPRFNRNSCSNGPASVLAARLYQRFGNEEDLEWAKKIFEWQTKHLVDPVSGNVYDGLVLEENGTIHVNTNWIFTYNQGTYLGTAVELYKITGDERYLASAEKTAEAALDYHVNKETAVMSGEGAGDGGLFRGILIRYLVDLYETGGNGKIKELIYHNADTLLSKGSTEEDGLFGIEWDRPAQEPLDLSVQLSGVFLLEAAAKLERLEEAN
ncbi:glycoside hydrolase family 76 protein [Paenibacillus thermotolerans]|uniref:glycoside hydrolase family 76 protein n=1 Tax=Paenibacillus thermotolerans TaxID=3027807 RepID=UPI0023677BDA|nr:MULTISPECIES: glycoside hydrolase family 76 protein [unclassified Paenibacillus]